MGCPVCNQQVINVPAPQNPVVQTCTYTLDQVTEWQTLLTCAKLNNLFDVASINQGLGIVQSAIGRPDNVCYFQNYLRLIEPLITQIIATGQC